MNAKMERRFITICIIVLCLIGSCTSQGSTGIKSIDQCSNWNASAPVLVFGQMNMTAGNDEQSLNLSINGLTIDWKTGSIAIADDNNHRVIVLYPTYLSQINNTYNSTTFLAVVLNSSNSSNASIIQLSPSAIAYNGNSSLYITDMWQSQVTTISIGAAPGDLLTMMVDIQQSISATNPTPSTNVTGMCVNNTDGSVLLADQDHHRIVRYWPNTTNSTIVAGNGTAGNSSRQLNRPTSIAIDNQQRLFVNDAGNNRIQMFEVNSMTGTTLAMNNITNCKSLTFHPSGVIIMNTGTSVYLFNLTNNTISCKLGCGNDNANLSNAHSVLIDINGNMLVSDSNRLRLFSIYRQCPYVSQLTTEIPSNSAVSLSIIPVNNCPTGKFGTDCTASLGPCNSSQPCLNGGICSENTSLTYGYSCECQWGFNGINCQIDSRPCKPFTCFQHGLCINTSSTEFECQCDYGYQGQQCELQINFCANVTCLNKGVCFPKYLNYTCQCVPGYSGRYCEIVETSTKAHIFISRSCGYIAILSLAIIVGFFVSMDILKYVFGIDPIETERVASQKYRRMKKKQTEANKPPTVLRVHYVHKVEEGQMV